MGGGLEEVQGLQGSYCLSLGERVAALDWGGGHGQKEVEVLGHQAARPWRRFAYSGRHKGRSQQTEAQVGQEGQK